MSADGLANQGNLERQVNRLAEERAALFDKAGATFGLSGPDRERLTAVERELDEIFLLRRQARADQDARRFARDGWPPGVPTRRKAP